METNLLPIGQIIKYSQKSGVSFGHGDPKIHLAYLTKLRLLPQTVRRKIGDKIEGCYPEYILPLLKRIEELKDRGLTYSQIKFQLQNVGEIQDTSREIQVRNQEARTWSPLLSSFQPPASLPVSNFLNPASGSSNNILAFLIIGLLLGYLLAINNVNHPAANNQQLTSTNQSQAVASTVSPLDQQSQTMVRLVTNQDSSENQPLYLIAVPQKNLYRLGSVNINDLVKTK